MLVEELAPQYKLYVDMDGVIADFMAGVRTELNFDVEEARLETDSKYRNQFWKAIRAHSKAGGEIWRHLPQMSDAMVLWNYVKQHNPTILTAAGDPMYNATPQKHAWVKEHLGNVPVIVTAKSAEKAQYAEPNAILIDDRQKSIQPWTAAGGIGIFHTSAQDSINQLKKLGI